MFSTAPPPTCGYGFRHHLDCGKKPTCSAGWGGAGTTLRIVQDYVDGSHYFTHLALTRGQPVGEFIEAREPDPIGQGTRDDLTRLPAPEE